MRIYISLPISGHDPERSRERAEIAKAMVERKGHTAVTPFEVCPDPGLSYAEYIGRDITALLRCDGIFQLAGWSLSKGCQIEWRAAQTFGKKIYTHISQIMDKGCT